MTPPDGPDIVAGYRGYTLKIGRVTSRRSRNEPPPGAIPVLNQPITYCPHVIRRDNGDTAKYVCVNIEARAIDDFPGSRHIGRRIRDGR